MRRALRKVALWLSVIALLLLPLVLTALAHYVLHPHTPLLLWWKSELLWLVLLLAAVAVLPARLERMSREVKSSAENYSFILGNPMSTAMAQSPALEDRAAPFPRVVNLSVGDEKESLSAGQVLQCGASYQLNLDIGPKSANSIVNNPATLPEDMLRMFMQDEDGLMLNVVVSSRHFQILTPDLPLFLPRHGASETIHFQIQAPAEPVTGRIRVVLYHQQNVLQSLMMSATVEQAPALRPTPALRAEVEYCLCGTLQDIEMYPPRTLNFLTNESPDGTHTFQVMGSNLRENFTFGEGEMRTSLAQTRAALLDVCAVIDATGKPTGYRYDPDSNRGTQEQFVRDVKKLACAGIRLYSDFVTNKDQSFADELRTRLASKSHIQVTAVNSAKYVFPWALIYDRPLLEDPDNAICQDFLDALAHASQDPGSPEGLQTWLHNCPCFSSAMGCSDDPNIICPSGFWGFKHILEQPPSVPYRDGRPIVDTPTHIKVSGTARMAMTINNRLLYTSQHYQEMASLGRYTISLTRGKREMLRALKLDPDTNVVYFYCHGGKENGTAFLSVGDDERFSATDLVTLHLTLPSHPLVFINGCRTAELTPDDLLNFVRTFTWCQAAGVIGTEISIPESLAREFAVAIFDSMAKPQAELGEVIYAERLRLLSKYNLLGLAYTPYCHASLQFEENAA